MKRIKKIGLRIISLLVIGSVIFAVSGCADYTTQIENNTTSSTNITSTTKETAVTEKTSDESASDTKETTENNDSESSKTTTTQKVTTTKSTTTTTKKVTTTRKPTTTKNTTTKSYADGDPDNDDSNGITVYRTPSGKRYHLDPDCGGKNSYEVSIGRAKSAGLTPCKKCAQ